MKGTATKNPPEVNVRLEVLQDERDHVAAIGAMTVGSQIEAIGDARELANARAIEIAAETLGLDSRLDEARVALRENDDSAIVTYVTQPS